MSRDDPRETPKSSFTIVDRRPLTEDGEIRRDLPPDRPAEPAPPVATAGHGLAEGFEELIELLATPAFICLGALPNPETGKGEINLPLAQRYIGLLELFQAKAKGNLSAEELGILEPLLSRLKMTYVQATRSGKGKGGK